MVDEKKKTQLTTQDDTGKRLTVYPAVVKGFWYKRRAIFQWILLFVFLVIPWLEWGGNPLLQFNIPERRFFIFGLNLWAHDAPLIFFVLGIAAFGLFIVTAIFGRVWCGWACPQTVFIERVFRQIEIWTEGNHLKRRKLNQSGMSKEKIIRKSIKWVLYLGFAWVISNCFLAYFTGKDQLFEMMSHSPYENPTSFAIMAFFFGGVLFDFVWFREQFCTLVCPYGRFQSVLMDTNSLLVAYDQKRGEPRGKLKKNDPAANEKGDCIDCNKCVTVCPTGIDIRNGTQMECIACTACIDACDDVMEKIKKPKGLISYTSEGILEGQPHKILNARSISYSLIIVAMVLGLVFSLATKEEMQIQKLRHSSLPYQILKTNSGSSYLQNIVKLRIHNQSEKDFNIEFDLKNKSTDIKLINPIPVYPAKQKHSFEISLIIQTFSNKFTGKDIILIATDKENKFEKEISVRLLGPAGGI